MFRIRVAVTVTLPILIIFASASLKAQDYPTKLIRIFSSEPGGGTDYLSRTIAQGISLGQPIIVENRGGNIIPLADMIAKSPPDGHTLLIWGSGLWIAPFLQKADYDPIKDFSPITWATTQVSVLIVHPSLPVNNVKDLIALAKRRPGELNYASAGTGGPAHLHMELFRTMAGNLNLVRVNYKSTPRGTLATIGGEIQLMFTTAGTATAPMKTGKVKVLAVTSAQPTPVFPGIPTVAATVPGYEALTYFGVYAPAKTPPAIITRLNQEIVRLLTRPEVKERFFANSTEVVASSPEQFAAEIKSDMNRWGKVVRDGGIKEE